MAAASPRNRLSYEGHTRRQAQRRARAAHRRWAGLCSRPYLIGRPPPICIRDGVAGQGGEVGGGGDVGHQQWPTRLCRLGRTRFPSASTGRTHSDAMPQNIMFIQIKQKVGPWMNVQRSYTLPQSLDYDRNLRL